MKGLLINLVLLLNLSASAQDSAFVLNEDPMLLFDHANEAFKADEFERSIELYQSILSSDNESWELHFNLGNAYFKSGNTSRAILHYEKAKKTPARPGRSYNQS